MRNRRYIIKEHLEGDYNTQGFISAGIAEEQPDGAVVLNLRDPGTTGQRLLAGCTLVLLPVAPPVVDLDKEHAQPLLETPE